MKQYRDAKDACGDALLFFRMGDFYELFDDDARLAAEQLGLTLTSRDKGDNPIPMAGFPHHQLEGYLGRLIKKGFRVAICDQVEDPKQAKGLVKREVTRVVTPGTLTDEALLDPRECNFLASVIESSASKKSADRGEDLVGLAWVELSTARFEATTIAANRLDDELARISPAECLISEDALPISDHLQQAYTVTKRPGWAFAGEAADERLRKQFGTATLEGFGFEQEDALAIRAAGAILDYLGETQKASVEHIERLVRYQSGCRLEIDEATRRSLEITRTLRDGGRAGSLLAVIDHTVTAMGARLLTDWIANPLTNVDDITFRLDAVEEFVAESTLSDALRCELRSVYDMQRLLARVATGRSSPRDLAHVGKTLRSLPKIKAKLTARKAELLRGLESSLDLCPEVRGQLDAALMEDCPLASRDGGFIREGYNSELDELRKLATGGKQWIAQYQAQEQQRTAITSLKVGYNKVFGYYIEVTNSHRDKVPENYIRKQTLKNAERYITPELKEYEERVLTADDKAKRLEYDLFVRLRELVRSHGRRIQVTADGLAKLDVLLSLAELARLRNYCRPVPVDDVVLRIENGRHPVLDILEPEGTFVPNDTHSGPEEDLILLITGPNMAGKSTYIRQVALITLMAQMGSFVPASKATIGVADRIFARVGASDQLARGQSTFMVEMTETARILNTATARSLVVLDEIGRGTSTYDGLSLAWSIVEHIHDHLGCRTFFATHYHELTDLEESFPAVSNLNVAVKEWEENVVFLHKIVDGAADKSYGIHVARLAGVPANVNERAKQILAHLENEHVASNGRSSLAGTNQKRKSGDLQLTLFGFADHPILDEIRDMELNQKTPLDALQCIKQWQDELANQTRSKPR